MQKHSGITRRWFLMGAASLAVARPLRAADLPSPNNKLNIASIGVGGKGAVDVRNVANGNNIVALCDVDDKQARGTFKAFPKATRYRDFRVMLDKQGAEIDAVTISTPDNTHAVAAMACMESGKPVFVQKPLAHDIYEARKLTEAARKYKVATHMGNQGHASEGLRLIQEWIDADYVGPVREVICWTDRPGRFWRQAIPRPTERPPVPDSLSWDLWLGPAPERPYHPEYLPDNWRGWWDFGCGALGDMGCHIMDPPHTALELGCPSAVEATCEGAENMDETYPSASVIRYEFPARGDKPPVTLTWYDGGKTPVWPEGIPEGETLGDGGTNGTLFVGEKGMLTCGATADSPRPVPYAKPEIEKTLPRSIGHYEEWIEACKGGAPARGNFDYAGPFTEMVLLGNLAMRAGQRITFDPPKMEVTNCPEANRFLRRPYRDGWHL